jgi:hypothetical protein
MHRLGTHVDLVPTNILSFSFLRNGKTLSIFSFMTNGKSLLNVCHVEVAMSAHPCECVTAHVICVGSPIQAMERQHVQARRASGALSEEGDDVSAESEESDESDDSDDGDSVDLVVDEVRQLPSMIHTDGWGCGLISQTHKGVVLSR